MTTNAIAGVGAQLKRGDGASSETFNAIAEINNINGPGLERSLYEATSLDSVGGYREYIPGFRDGGELSLEMNWTLDEFDDMLADFENDDPVNYQLVFPDTGNTTLDFAGYVMSLPPTIPWDDKITMSVTIKVTGAVTLTS